MKMKASRRSGHVVLEMGQKDSVLPPVAVPEVELKRILVPVDFSECSHKAFHYAIQFARQFNAELLLLHVLESVPTPPQPFILDVTENQKLIAEQYEEAAKQLSHWRREAAPNSSVRAVTRAGIAAHQEIIEAARENNADLIVIGNHGRTGLARLFLGGTTERVVRHAPCPVLVIREREHDFVSDKN